MLVPTVVTGEAFFDDQAPSFFGATAYVILEETSRADAPAQGVARLELSGVSSQPGQAPFTFAFPAVPLDPSKRYEIRMHIDLDADGRIGHGDQITTESYPVPIGSGRVHLKLRLRRI